MLTKQSLKHNFVNAQDICLQAAVAFQLNRGAQVSICTLSKDSSSSSNTGSSNSSSSSPTAVKLRKLQHGQFQQQAVIITPADLQPG